MKTPHIGFLGLLVAMLAATATTVLGQETPAWRAHFAAGEEARRGGEAGVYAREMAAAAEAMPEGHLNRPFVQYHAARAAALVGDADAAVDWLATAWDEDIEALMISFATHDPAFEDVADTPAFEEVIGRASSMRLSVRTLADGVALVQGAGSNVLAVTTDDGILLVDTGYGPALPALRDAIGTSTGDAVRHVIVTHPHEDHMGATPELGGEAVVHAHPGTTAAMREPYVFIEGVTLPPKPAEALPDEEIAGDTTLVIGGVEIRVKPTVAHTTGDLSVYFPGARVAHLGDTWLAANPMMFPGRQDPSGFLDDLEAFLDSMHPETVVVGGHEEPADLAAVRSQIETSRAAMDFVRDALDAGSTLEEAAEAGADRFPPQWIAFFWGVLAEGED